jgi:hypothetical protein
MNSRVKGKVGEREFAALLRSEGFEARRGQQYSGGSESPDVVCPALDWLHIEVKRVQALNLDNACAQAKGDAKGKPWVVAHRRNHAPWLVTMRAETFFRLLRGEFADRGRRSTSSGLRPPSPKSGEGGTDKRDVRQVAEQDRQVACSTRKNSGALECVREGKINKEKG